MKTTPFIGIALLTSLAIATPALFAKEDAAAAPKTGKEMIEKPAVQPGTLTKTIADSATFATLTKALKAAELDITLGTEGTYTIFAPTDEAFGKLPAGTLDKLLLPENKEKLRSLLLYHVIAGKMLAADLKDGEVKTMNGEKIEVEIEDDRIEVNDAKVFSSDVMASNGVMHSVDRVIVPKSLDGFAGLDD